MTVGPSKSSQPIGTVPMFATLENLDDRSLESRGLRQIVERRHRTAKDEVEYVVVVIAPERQRS